jgi:hypothetical protein
MGATSLTEAWDAGRGSSQDHFMLGQINEWFYHDLAGIQADPAAPGFRRVIIRPAIVGDLRWVKARFESIHGAILSSWRREGAGLSVDVTIPANASAAIYVPAVDARSVLESGRPAALCQQVRFLRMEKGAAVFEVGSGRYRFSSRGAFSYSDRPATRG